MTNTYLYDALEICLQALEQGSDLETCLQRFPELTAELRPLLETALLARSAAEVEIPVAVLRRGKARVLQAAAEMREQAIAPRRRPLLGGFFRLALVALALFVFILMGGTGLVLAAEASLPGDGLYPVKRGWENLRLAVASDPLARAEIETELLKERRWETVELLRAGRSAQVYFQGLVEAQGPTFWTIDGLKVEFTDQTKIEGEIMPGAQVEVWGLTQHGAINAERIRLLLPSFATPLPAALPTDQPVSTPTLSPSSTAKVATPTSALTLTLTLAPTETLQPVNPLLTRTPQPASNGNDNENSDNSNDDSSNDNDNDDDDKDKDDDDSNNEE